MRKSSKEDRSNTTGYGSDEDSYTPAFYLDRGHPENFLMIQKSSSTAAYMYMNSQRSVDCTLCTVGHIRKPSRSPDLSSTPDTPSQTDHPVAFVPAPYHSDGIVSDSNRIPFSSLSRT